MSNNISESISSKTNGATQDFKSKAMNAEHQLEAMTRNAGERVGRMASDLASTTSDYAKASREYVQENPVKGVAIAAAAGAVAGCLLTLAFSGRRH